MLFLAKHTWQDILVPTLPLLDKRHELGGHLCLWTYVPTIIKWKEGFLSCSVYGANLFKVIGI